MSDQLLKEILLELKGVRSELTSLNDRVGNIEAGQERIETRVGNLEAGQEHIQTQVKRIETRIENDVVDKVRALFDAREVQRDTNAKILDKLEDIEINTNYLVAKVTRLEKIAK